MNSSRKLFLKNFPIWNAKHSSEQSNKAVQKKFWKKVLRTERKESRWRLSECDSECVSFEFLPFFFVFTEKERERKWINCISRRRKRGESSDSELLNEIKNDIILYEGEPGMRKAWDSEYIYNEQNRTEQNVSKAREQNKIDGVRFFSREKGFLFRTRLFIEAFVRECVQRQQH